MAAAERRSKLLGILKESGRAVPGKELAKRLNVSRQVIVQDIALLRANGEDIFSTNVGYICPGKKEISRVFKTCHTDDEVREELCLIVDCGGTIKDVFVYHKVYGVIKAALDIKSRADIEHFITELNSGRSSLLKNVTSGYHYHTVTAETREVMDMIERRLKSGGFLAELTDYEPAELDKDGTAPQA